MSSNLPNKAVLVASAEDLARENKSLCNILSGNQTSLEEWLHVQEWKNEAIESLGDIQDGICSLKGELHLFTFAIIIQTVQCKIFSQIRILISHGPLAL